MDLGIKGRIALITGGSKGIGGASAYLLAQEGARIAISARTPASRPASATACAWLPDEKATMPCRFSSGVSD